MRNLEQELKLKLDEREYNLIAGLTKNQPQLQVNFYFTSPSLSKETMVRIREKRGQYLLCCKTRLQYGKGISVCSEHECEIDGHLAITFMQRGILSAEMQKLLGVEFEEVLIYVGKMETYRTTFKHEDWTLELDKSLYFDLCDYELECESAYVQELDKLKNYLVYNFGIAIKESYPKSYRFFNALKQRP